MDVEVCSASAAGIERVSLTVADGCTVREAVAQSGIERRMGLDPATLAFAVFGRRVAPETILAPGDRVELLRPLQVDPKDARRRRAAKKAAKSPR